MFEKLKCDILSNFQTLWHSFKKLFVLIEAFQGCVRPSPIFWVVLFMSIKIQHLHWTHNRKLKRLWIAWLMRWASVMLSVMILCWAVHYVLIYWAALSDRCLKIGFENSKFLLEYMLDTWALNIEATDLRCEEVAMLRHGDFCNHHLRACRCRQRPLSLHLFLEMGYFCKCSNTIPSTTEPHKVLTLTILTSSWPQQLEFYGH